MKTTLITNAKILSLTGEPPAAWMFIRGDRIDSLGAGEPPPTEADETLNLRNRVILPGLTDAHIHLSKYALNAGIVDCETSTIGACLERLATRVQELPPDRWLLGHGWDQNRWGTFGHRRQLDQISRMHPILVTAKSLHAAWANSRALELAGISEGTEDPDNGAIQQDADGVPTGILFEEAIDLVRERIPSASIEQIASAIGEAQVRLWTLGITAVHDFDGPRCFQALQLLEERGELGLRVTKNLPVGLLDHATAVGLRTGFGGDWIRIGNVKVFADGALGPRTAAMIAPYEGEPDNRGILMIDSEELLEIGIKAADAGLGMTVHAIGDHANHVVLDSYQSLRRYEADHQLPRMRHRIEHLQLLHPVDLKRAGELGVVASMQPIHATSDMPAADRYWGSRAQYSYTWKSQLEAGATLAFGSDAPVEDPNPFWGLHAAVTRRRRDGSPRPEGWIPDERISLTEALRAYTIGAAYAAYREDVIGQLKPGFFADLIILEEDPFRLDPEALASVRVSGTMVGGNWRYQSFGGS